MKLIIFPDLLMPEMVAHVKAGGQALEQWDKSYTYGPRAPACFRGKDFVKLYDQDKLRLIETARGFGVKVIKVDRPGTLYQHIDLVGAPMRKALAAAEPFAGKLPGNLFEGTAEPQDRDKDIFEKP
jgi:hypothetical protein